MTNIYWPVFKNLERNLGELTFAIHVDDRQLDKYSSKITDLILRAAAEIESLAKELYKMNGGPKTGEIKYDEDAIKYLKRLWLLDKKVVVISGANCFQSNRVLTPFVKNETRTGSAKQTYSWNNAYQNLKHDRGNSLPFGSVRYLFDIMAALYVLNIYYKDENIDLGKDAQATTFPNGVGSNVFAVQIARACAHRGSEYMKGADFDESIYFVNWTKESSRRFMESNAKTDEHRRNAMLNHPKLIEYFSIPENVAKLNAGKVPNIIDLLGAEEHKRILIESIKSEPMMTKLNNKLVYEAVLNKNQAVEEIA